MIDHASAESIVTAANRAGELLTARIADNPDSPLVPDLIILVAAAKEIATEHGAYLTNIERRTT
jgi:hypothetical protein